MQANVGDKDNNAQLDLFIENLHMSGTYTFNNETVSVFLKRTGLEGILEYKLETLYEILLNVINAATYNKLGDVDRNKNVQEALVQIFKQFTSYSIQVINRYFSNESTLLCQRSPSYGIDMNKISEHYYLNESEYMDVLSRGKTTESVKEAVGVNATNSYSNIVLIEDPTTSIQESKLISIAQINLPPPYPIEVHFTETHQDQETLLFLSMNV